MSNESEDSPMLKHSLKQFISDMEWNDEVEEKDDESTLSSSWSINGQSHRFYVKCHESSKIVKVYTFSPFAVPQIRKKEMSFIFNFVNWRIRIGRFALDPHTADSEEVQYHALYDVEDGQLSPKMIYWMVVTGRNSFKKYGSLMAAVALTKVSAEDAIVEFLKEEKLEQAKDEQTSGEHVPDEL